MNPDIKTIDFFSEVFTPYPHQLQLIRDVFLSEKRFFMQCWHRRGGKDYCMFFTAVLYACAIPGNYIYTLPKKEQARAVIWEGKDLKGVRWLDKIPRCLIKKTLENSCKIYFSNGSILHVTGADSILTSHLGSNLKGIFISEFQRTSPEVWDYLRPILLLSKGIAMFVYTAFGKGHAYRLFQQNIQNEHWSCQKLTVEDTVKLDGSRIFDDADIQAERDSGMDEDKLRQEYYCDEDVAIKGTFFAEELNALELAGRIKQDYHVERGLKVYTSWDLGSRDTNSIWFFQVVGHGSNIRFHYFLNVNHNYKSTDFYVTLLQEIQRRYGFKEYGMHFMPHDVEQVDYGPGKTRKVQFLINGVKPITVVPRMKIIERVQVTRLMLKHCTFALAGCAHGLEALRVARSKWDENAKCFTADEVHDWSSHPSAAFQYGLVGWQTSLTNPEALKQWDYDRVRS